MKSHSRLAYGRRRMVIVESSRHLLKRMVELM